MTGRHLAVVSLLLAAASAAAAPVRATRTAQEPDRIEAGRRLYEKKKCATCHQIDGRGNSRFPLDGVATRLSPDDLRRWLTETARMEAAQPRMPAIRMSTMEYRFNVEETAALVEYLRTLK